MTRRDWLALLTGFTPGLRSVAEARWLPAVQDSGDPTTLSMAELAAAFARGELTPIDVTAAYLKRIADLDPALGAFITVTRERAFDDTQRIMRRGAAGVPEGALAGVPVAHKDLFATRGIRTTGGSKLHEHWVPETDAALVARLADAGTVLLGKTNTHELGGGVTTINPFFGTTHNPHDATRIAGGSSGGSAAAVAARLALLATGSDTGGSIRIPAALCGCVGLKPTFGLLPTTGLLGACPSFDHAGFIARSAEDIALALAAVLDGRARGESLPAAASGGNGAGLSPAAPAPSAGGGARPDTPTARTYREAAARGVKGLRVAVERQYFLAALDAGVRAAVEQTLERLRAAGARVVDVSTALHDRSYGELFDPIAVSEIRTTYARDWRATPEAFSHDFAGVFAGDGPSPAVVAAARTARAAFQRQLDALLAAHDVLLTPTVPVVAPRIDGAIDGMRILRNTWPFNAAGVPAVTVPCGTGEDGLPVGLQLVAARGADARLLGFAAALTRL